MFILQLAIGICFAIASISFVDNIEGTVTCALLSFVWLLAGFINLYCLLKGKRKRNS